MSPFVVQEYQYREQHQDIFVCNKYGYGKHQSPNATSIFDESIQHMANKCPTYQHITTYYDDKSWLFLLRHSLCLCCAATVGHGLLQTQLTAFEASKRSGDPRVICPLELQKSGDAHVQTLLAVHFGRPDTKDDISSRSEGQLVCQVCVMNRLHRSS